MARSIFSWQMVDNQEQLTVLETVNEELKRQRLPTVARDLLDWRMSKAIRPGNEVETVNEELKRQTLPTVTRDLLDWRMSGAIRPGNEEPMRGGIWSLDLPPIRNNGGEQADMSCTSFQDK